MSNTFVIQSKLTDTSNNYLLVDIAEGGGSPAPKKGAHLEAYTPTSNKNQLWKAVPDSAHPGYFFIQSLQPDNDGKTLVIDIQGITETNANKVANGTPLDAYTNDPRWHENQLWRVALNPATKPNLSAPGVEQADFIFIQSYLKNSLGVPYVIDIQGWDGGKNPSKATALDAYPQKRTNIDNQLWVLDPLSGGDDLVPTITGFSPFFNTTNPAETTLGVLASGFYPGVTVALRLSTVDVNGFLTQGAPILAVTDFAGNLDAVGRLVADWGYPSLGTENQFSVAAFYNDASILEARPAAAASAQWTGVGISGFSNH